jgi:photosystem II stability/assembly factor-like uncharacterized protein
MKSKSSLIGLALLMLVVTFPLARAQNTEPQETGRAEEQATQEKKDVPARNAPADPLEGLKFRNLGPAAGGGRVTAVVGVPGQSNVYYAGAAAGGVFRTNDGGLSWKPIFEKETVASIGAIALAPSNPNIVWVGTGEANIRNDISGGRGVYMSTDGGTTWRFMGLKDAGQISSVVVDPDNPNTVFVGAIGHAWGPNTERGVFRTTDGGKTWAKVLYINDTTGASSLIMDPGNPMILYAGMWQVQRHPWMMVSGGTSGGIYRSLDGGSTWKKLTDGLPEGATGRIGLGAAPSNPRHIYALVEAKKGILWDSIDLGDHWREVSNNHALNARPFYFSELMVSPKDESRVYFLSFDVLLSEDGGKTARVIGRGVHPDNHTMWIDPQNPDRVILGNDGGVYVSADAGRSWRFLDNLPIEQFYMVAADDETPYNLCGGLQDNNGWCGPSNSLSNTGITNDDWYTVVGGDGEYVIPAPGASHIIYADSQNGSIRRLDKRNGLSKSLRPYLQGVGAMKPSDLKYRFNWTSPIAVSYSNADEIYLGGNVLFKSTDGGAHWTPISPDLTRNDKSKQESSGGPVELDLSGAETFDTILSIAISPVDPKIIWVGTDDGVVQVTRDGGAHWTNVITNVKGLPQWGRLQQIEASPLSADTAYIAVDFHEVDNDKPYVFKTNDFGQTWTSIAQGLPQDQPAKVIREDPNRKGFLVVGTETGLFYSTNDGASWTSIKSNFPTVPVYDIKFIRKSHDMIVATHGRGLFVLDNITPLEETNTQPGSFQLFSTLAANHWLFWNKRGFSLGGYTAPNPPRGATIDYYLPAEIKATPEQTKKRETPVKIVVTDEQGATVRTLYGPAKMGFNRASWDLRYAGAKRLNFIPTPPAGEREETDFPSFASAGPPVIPGTYKIAVTVNGKTATETVQVGLDPRLQTDLNAFRAQIQAGLELRDELSALVEALNRINSLKKQLATLQELLGSEGQGQEVQAAYKPVMEQARLLSRKLEKLEQPIYNNEIQPGASDSIHFLERFHDRLQGLMRSVVSDYGQAPSEVQREAIAEVCRELESHLQAVNQFLSTDVAAFNKLATERGASTLFAGLPIEVKAGDQATAGTEDDEQ